MKHQSRHKSVLLSFLFTYSVIQEEFIKSKYNRYSSYKTIQIENNFKKQRKARGTEQATI